MYFRLLQNVVSDLTFHILNNQTIPCLLTHLLFFGFIFDRWCFRHLTAIFHICSITAKNVIRKEEQSFFIEATRNKSENCVGNLPIPIL